jgi:hypothetical protein
MKPKPLNSAQIRAARALLRWRAAQLAREAALGLATIKRAELAGGETSMPWPTIWRFAVLWKLPASNSSMGMVLGRGAPAEGASARKTQITGQSVGSGSPSLASPAPSSGASGPRFTKWFVPCAAEHHDRGYCPRCRACRTNERCFVGAGTQGGGRSRAIAAYGRAPRP